ncbi:MAG: flagellar export chaperone FliS [Pyrinomonadaceae bacterium]
MNSKPRALQSYGRIANGETDPLRQIVMLYDGAIKFLNLAAESIDADDIPGKAENTTRALDILSYMQSILDFQKGGDVAVALDNLYKSTIVLILRASAELDSDLMRQSAKLLQPVRDAWETNANSQNQTQPSPTLPIPANIKVAV